MKEKNDIGQIISSKLDNKYNDDFFDESKGWDTLMAKLPQKGFWNWGFKHINVYYVSLSLLLIAALVYVAKDNVTEETKPTTTILSIDDNDGAAEFENPINNNSVKKNKGADLPSKNLLEEKQTTSTDDQIISTDSVIDVEKHNRGPAEVPAPAIATEISQEPKAPHKETITPENTLQPPPKNIETSKISKDSFAQPILKRDTIRRKIKRFD